MCAAVCCHMDFPIFSPNLLSRQADCKVMFDSRVCVESRLRSGEPYGGDGCKGLTTASPALRDTPWTLGGGGMAGFLSSPFHAVQQAGHVAKQPSPEAGATLRIGTPAHMDSRYIKVQSTPNKNIGDIIYCRYCV